MVAFYSNLAGHNFRGAADKEALKQLWGKDMLFNLERDPTNKYDSNAIKVVWQSPHDASQFHLGFIESVVAAKLAPLMDDNILFSCSTKSWADPKKPLLLIEEIKLERGNPGGHSD